MLISVLSVGSLALDIGYPTSKTAEKGLRYPEPVHFNRNVVFEEALRAREDVAPLYIRPSFSGVMPSSDQLWADRSNEFCSIVRSRPSTYRVFA